MKICDTFVRSDVQFYVQIAQSKVQYPTLYVEILHNYIHLFYIMCYKMHINTDFCAI